MAIYQVKFKEHDREMTLHTSANSAEEAKQAVIAGNDIAEANIISTRVNPTGNLIFPGGTPAATTGDVKKFCERVQPLYKYGILSVQTGKKYHKIVQDSNGQLSVYAFVDGYGNVFKPAGWKAPAKHIRGNIFSEKGGLEALDSQGFVRYL